MAHLPYKQECPCPHCWEVPKYQAEDQESAIGRFLDPEWPRYYLPEGLS